MEYLEFKIDIEPSEAVDKINSYDKLQSSLVFDDHKTIKASKEEIIIMVFEKYFLRTHSNASLTVTVDNLNRETIVKCISSSSGGLLNLSWETDKDFITLVKNVLEPKAEDIIQGGDL